LALIVEAKVQAVHSDETESQLKQYMLAMGCPVGLLATLSKIKIYYDQYVSAGEDSVQVVGEYASPPEWAVLFERHQSTRGAGAGFEDVVRGWLEGLATESGLLSLPAGLRRGVEEFLIPALNQGTVRAAHPRSA
jgi:hypothetical protein